MKKQVLQILQLDPDAYQMLVMDLYLDWCSKKSKNRNSLQKVLCCRPLFNWWYLELQKLEASFADEAKCYIGQINPETALDFYKDSIKPINNLFSKPLIKKAHDA